MDEITKELLDALKPFAAFFDAVEHMGGNYPKTGAIYSVTSHIGGHRELSVEDFKQARGIIAKAEAILADPQPSADAVEAAFREGFRSPTTYNDTVMNSEDDAWENSEARAEAAKAAPQPADDGWIPWGGGACPVEVGTRVDAKFRDGEKAYNVPAGDCAEDPDSRSALDWSHMESDYDIIAYRVVKP